MQELGGGVLHRNHQGFQDDGESSLPDILFQSGHPPTVGGNPAERAPHSPSGRQHFSGAVNLQQI